MKKEATSRDYTGHRKRIKEKYKKAGISGWLDYEVLEFVLSYAIPRKDTKRIARELLARYKTINAVLDAERHELLEIRAITEHAALFFSLLKDIAILYLERELYGKDLLSSPEYVYNYLKGTLKSLPDEELKVLFLDARNRLIKAETIEKGTVDKAVIYPRKIAEKALYYHAANIIIAHNHPGGSLEPSDDDRHITHAIRAALKTVDIELLDHIIIGGNGYYSFSKDN